MDAARLQGVVTRHFRDHARVALSPRTTVYTVTEYTNANTIGRFHFYPGHNPKKMKKSGRSISRTAKSCCTKINSGTPDLLLSYDGCRRGDNQRKASEKPLEVRIALKVLWGD